MKLLENVEQNSFDVLFYANPQPMWIFNVNTLKILEVNAAAIERYGYSKEEFLSRTISDLRPPEDIPYLQNLLPSIRESKTNEREFRHMTKTGTVLFVNIISYPIIFKGTNARVVYARSMDEKRELAGKLQLTQERLLLILETTVLGFLQLDYDWTITYWNKSAESLIGYQREDVLGKNLWEVLPEILHSNFNASFQTAMTKRENIDFIDYFWPTQRWFMCNAYPAEGGLLVHFRDITKRKLTQESLLEKLDQLKEISYLNSHALRKPIASLLGLTQLILANMVKPEEYKEVSALINECSLELDEVVKEVNRKVSNDDYLHPLDSYIDTFNFNTFLIDVVSKMQPAYTNHQLIITHNVDLVFYGNRQGIEMSLKYLIENAVKFSPNSDSVFIQAELINQNLILSVKDTGVGMDDLQMHRLFMHINQKKHVSFSSGLPRINEICRRHHGNIWIESTPGMGSVFSLRFPLSNIGTYKATGHTNFTVYQNPTLEINYDEQRDCLLVNWIGFQNRNTVKDGCNRILNMMTAHNCRRIFNDNSNVLGGWMEACDWIVNKWLPVAQHRGLQYLAWVYSPSTFSKLSTIYALGKFKGDIKSKAFDDLESALKWLDNFN
jgi:PAS domain S-box-containing protein